MMMILGRRESLEDDLRREKEEGKREKERERKRETAKVGDREKVRERRRERNGQEAINMKRSLKIV